MTLFTKLSKGQKIIAFALSLAALWNLVPENLKLMTRGSHKADTNYLAENIAVRTIEYYTEVICRGEGVENDHQQLSRSLQKYKEVTETDHWYVGMSEEARCHAALAR